MSNMKTGTGATTYQVCMVGGCGALLPCQTHNTPMAVEQLPNVVDLAEATLRELLTDGDMLIIGEWETRSPLDILITYGDACYALRPRDT